MVSNVYIITLMLVLVGMLGTAQLAHADRYDAYMSGFKHGQADGKIGHIAEDSASHTAAYDQGWVDGYCSIAGRGAGSDSDKGTFECNFDATQFKNLPDNSTSTTNSTR
jgi:hypothetical protein